jgi:pimeloyl-ACP methyl ester carboxylesterase
MTAPPPHPTPRERRVATNGIELHLVEAGPADGFPVVLAHGFPELAWSWRHQIPALAEAGYHVLAPDQRGYGRSSRPEAIDDYDIVHLTDDLLGLLDDVGAERAVFVGHDWGSMVVWQQSLLHPERVKGVVGMSVPFLPRGPMSPVQMMRQVMGDNFFYILYFQEPGVAEKELEADVHTTMRKVLVGIAAGGQGVPEPLPREGTGFLDQLADREGPLPAWLTEADLDTYVAAYEASGFFGPVSYYRNLDRNWERNHEIDASVMSMPIAFIAGVEDPVVSRGGPNLVEAAHSVLPNYRGATMIEGAGHWVQQEKPEETNAALFEFLRSL